MSQFLMEQMMADMMMPPMPFQELDQLGAQFDGKTLMELLDELDPSMFDDDDEFDFFDDDDWLDEYDDDQ